MSNYPRYSPPTDLSRYALLSIAAAVATIMLKGVAAYLTGSVGLLSDAAESLVNLVAALMAFVMLKISIKPPDDNHPFGHSKAEYFSSITEGVMIFVAAAFIILAATDRIIAPRMPEQLGIGLAINVIASLINAGVAVVLLRAAKKHRSTALEADGKHIITDVITSIAVLVGVALVAITQLPILDPIVALVAGVNILRTGYGLITKSVRGLMDIAIDPEISAQLTGVLDRHKEDGVIDFHAVRTREAGNRQYMEFHILVPGDWSVKRGHDLTEDIIDDIVETVPNVRVSAHLEPIEDPKSYQDEKDY